MWTRCNIEVFSVIHPTEDPQKVKHAVTNVIKDSEVDVTNTSVKAISDDLMSLRRVQEIIQAHKSQKAYQRNFKKNLVGDNTWIYLNKQAALVNKISLCEEEDESPLGPIKVILKSRDIERVIEWFVNP